MDALLDVPLSLRLGVLFALGTLAAGLANAAVYGWAFDSRRVSPWQPDPEGVSPRGWRDRVPVLGWWGLRRDSAKLGRGFWVRPMLIEVGFGLSLAALYWWEVDQLGLIRGQVTDLFRFAESPAPPIDAEGIAWPLHAMFLAHACMGWLMLVATFIDIDEKTIPDAVTVPGVLLGLVLATLAPGVHLPDVEPAFLEPNLSWRLTDATGPPEEALVLQPVHMAAPRAYPAPLGAPHAPAPLALGLGCFWLWCFALTTRIWRRGRGVLVALGLIFTRVRRELWMSPLREILLLGTCGIVGVWWLGGAPWQGLLTALVGMVGSGCLVWGVRIIGSAALGREAMGFGDVTLMMMLGTVLGWQAALFVFFLAPFAGVVMGIANFVLRGTDVIPYGPYLCLASVGVIVGWAGLWTRFEFAFGAGWLVPAMVVVCLVLLGVMLAAWQGIKSLLLGRSNA